MICWPCQILTKLNKFSLANFYYASFLTVSYLYLLLIRRYRPFVKLTLCVICYGGNWQFVRDFVEVGVSGEGMCESNRILTRTGRLQEGEF